MCVPLWPPFKHLLAPSLARHISFAAPAKRLVRHTVAVSLLVPRLGTRTVAVPRRRPGVLLRLNAATPAWLLAPIRRGATASRCLAGATGNRVRHWCPRGPQTTHLRGSQLRRLRCATVVGRSLQTAVAGRLSASQGREMSKDLCLLGTWSLRWSALRRRRRNLSNASAVPQLHSLRAEPVQDGLPLQG